MVNGHSTLVFCTLILLLPASGFAESADLSEFRTSDEMTEFRTPSEVEHFDIYAEDETSPLVGQIGWTGLFLSVQLGVLIAAEPATWPGRAPSPEQMRQSFSGPPTTNDGDDWVTNYVGHPLMGGYLYVFARRTGTSVLGSFLWSTLSSVVWEYAFEGWYEQPSWSDLLVTSTVGTVIGEMMWRARENLMENGLQPAEYFLLALVDPATFLEEILSF